MCIREDVPHDNLAHSVTTVRSWGSLQLPSLSQLADEAGLDLPEVFLTGTLPIIVEGINDAQYFRHIWPLCSNGMTLESLGLRLFIAGGLPSTRRLIDELLINLYPQTVPIIAITDNPALDYPSGPSQIKAIKNEYPQVEVISHGAFDAWAFIPEDVLDRFTARQTGKTWIDTEAERRQLVKSYKLGQPARTLPGKASVLKPSATRKWPTILASITTAEIPGRARHVVEQVNARARKPHT